MRKYQAFIRQFQKSRRNRLKFKTSQRNIWSVRQNSHSHLSKKNAAQLQTCDSKSMLASVLYTKLTFQKYKIALRSI